MRLALRTLFWLVLASAVVIGWGVEHQRAANRLAELRHQAGWFDLVERTAQPSQAALERRARCEELSKLGNEELSNRAIKIVEFDDSVVFDELCLSEMVRRGLVKELQECYDRTMISFGAPIRFPDNLQALIALRRAQQQPDPLKIHVGLLPDHRGAQVLATVENTDVGQKSVFWEQGGDDDGGRRDNWRIELTDERGLKVPDANYNTSGNWGWNIHRGAAGVWRKGVESQLV